MKKPEKQRDMYCFIFILFIALFFSLQCSNNIIVYGESYTDSSVFKYVAYMITKGYMPYRDTFDHKGPLIYLINVLGIELSYWRGIWVVELTTIFIAFLFMYKIARLSCGRVASLIVLLVAVSPLFECFEGGNLTEEYALPVKSEKVCKLFSVENDIKLPSSWPSF